MSDAYKYYQLIHKRLFFPVFCLFAYCHGYAQVWQWSTSVDSVISSETNANPTAFLWIPPNCKQVRGVVVGQHNMLEEGILEHAEFRKTLTSIGFAEVWITPSLDMIFNFEKTNCGAYFNAMMKKLGVVSGYTELEFAPIVPIGHSAAASYPWNFGAWAPERTLAMLSIHGDAPLTNLTGSGQPNPNWGQRTIEGVPGLMVMGEYEWWYARLLPALRYRNEHPNAPISYLADAGHGHFDYSDGLVKYLGLFIKKVSEARLPKVMALDSYPLLKPVQPQQGWLADRWHLDNLPTAKPAPYKAFRGDTTQAFWYFDEAMADATESYYAQARGKQNQYIGFSQHDSLASFNPQLHARIVPKFEPQMDGVTFHIKAEYTDTLRKNLSNEHAETKIHITRICGPVMKLDDTSFMVSFYRMGFNNPKRSGDIWLMAESEGDNRYKSTVQQLIIRIPVSNTAGAEQHIDFPVIPDVKKNTSHVKLNATADQGLPVYYYVAEGPAEIHENKLTITKLPPRTKLPIKITVAAWQYGRSVEPKVQSAKPVTRTFYIIK